MSAPPPDQALFFVPGPQGPFGPITLHAIVDHVVHGRLPPDVTFTYQGATGWLSIASEPGARRLLDERRVALDDERDRVFGALVKKSWEYFHQEERATLIDEVLIGAVITSTLDNGFSLIDLRSTGEHHHLRFEELKSRARIVFQLRHLTPSLLASRVLGHQASVIVGYGEPVAEFGRVWQALKAEYKSGFIANPEPGTITVDADVTAGYVYVQIDLLWNIDDYVHADLSVDYGLLTTHVGSTVHALRKYLRGRTS
ncbi:MAG: hypothetical protein K1X94_00495 [Sandaracinaceae bacterium]|nr:hypothetical protein [Sandaracinaceae bacterium]